MGSSLKSGTRLHNDVFDLSHLECAELHAALEERSQHLFDVRITPQAVAFSILFGFPDAQSQHNLPCVLLRLDECANASRLRFYNRKCLLLNELYELRAASEAGENSTTRANMGALRLKCEWLRGKAGSGTPKRQWSVFNLDLGCPPHSC
jgi:hypothetical protein